MRALEIEEACAAMCSGMTIEKKGGSGTVDEMQVRGRTSRDGAEAGDNGRSGEITPLELTWALARLVENDRAVAGVLVEFARRRWLALPDPLPEERSDRRPRETTLMELSRVLVELLPNDRRAVDVLVALIRSRSLVTRNGDRLALEMREPTVPADAALAGLPSAKSVEPSTRRRPRSIRD
jgi:hypothetical protein